VNAVIVVEFEIEFGFEFEFESEFESEFEFEKPVSGAAVAAIVEDERAMIVP